MKKMFSLTLIFMTLCWTAFIFCLLYPVADDYLNKNNKKYIAAKMQEIDTIGEEIKLIKANQKNTASKIFPPEDVLIKAELIKTILVQIREKTDALNINTMKVDLGKLTKTTDSVLNVSEQNVTVTIHAPYNKIAQYINVLKSSPLLTEIKEVNITKKEESETLETIINFNVLCTS